jgi:hypothetical protein
VTVGKSDPELARAEAEVEKAREVVASSVMALQQELARTFDWRAWVAKRPYVAVGAVFFLGVALGGWHGPLWHKRR